MEMLEAYTTEYPEGDQIEIVKTRLFDINAEIGNWETVVDMWLGLSPETQNQIENLGSALDSFRLDNDRYPTTEEGLNALREKPGDL